MGLLDGKTALIFGVANKNSIAWGIAQSMHAQGAELAFSYAIPQLERRVKPLAESVNAKLVEEADATDDAALDRVFEKAADIYGEIDIVVHSIAFAGREALMGRFIDTDRDTWKSTLDISAYSMVAVAQRAEALMPKGGSMMTMTYYASIAVMPNYNIMAIAKAALEASVRYLAYDLGPKGIRVNAISAGPIKTLAAAGVSGFRDMYRYHEEVAPMRSMVSQEDVGDTAVWLASDWSKQTTGQVIYVDGGWNILGMTVPLDELKGGSSAD